MVQTKVSPLTSGATQGAGPRQSLAKGWTPTTQSTSLLVCSPIPKSTVSWSTLGAFSKKSGSLSSLHLFENSHGAGKDEIISRGTQTGSLRSPLDPIVSVDRHHNLNPPHRSGAPQLHQKEEKRLAYLYNPLTPSSLRSPLPKLLPSHLKSRSLLFR